MDNRTEKERRKNLTLHPLEIQQIGLCSSQFLAPTTNFNTSPFDPLNLFGVCPDIIYNPEGHSPLFFKQDYYLHNQSPHLFLTRVPNIPIPSCNVAPSYFCGAFMSNIFDTNFSLQLNSPLCNSRCSEQYLSSDTNSLLASTETHYANLPSIAHSSTLSNSFDLVDYSSVVSDAYIDSTNNINVLPTNQQMSAIDIQYEDNQNIKTPATDTQYNDNQSEYILESLQKDITTPNEQTLNIPSTIRYPCPISGCAKEFVRKQNLKSHLTSHSKEDNTFRCSKCNKTLKRLPDLYRHQRSIHGEGKLLVCQICHKAFGRMDTLKKHAALCNLASTLSS